MRMNAAGVTISGLDLSIADVGGWTDATDQSDGWDDSTDSSDIWTDATDQSDDWTGAA